MFQWFLGGMLFFLTPLIMAHLNGVRNSEDWDIWFSELNWNQYVTMGFMAHIGMFMLFASVFVPNDPS